MINHNTNFVIEKIFKIFMKTLMMTISEAEENVKYESTIDVKRLSRSDNLFDYTIKIYQG